MTHPHGEWRPTGPQARFVAVVEGPQVGTFSDGQGCIQKITPRKLNESKRLPEIQNLAPNAFKKTLVFLNTHATVRHGHSRKKRRIPVAILARVSTDKQANARQIHELRQAAAENGWTEVDVIETTGLSGNAKDADRHDLDRVRDLATRGRIRKVLVHEVSRIARRNSTAHKFLEELEALGVSLYWHAQRIETLLPDGKRNPAASIMFSLLAEMARNERETLVDRINSGLARARREGTTLGRPKGTHFKRADFLANHKDVVKQLRAGQSIRNTARITGKGVSTVQRVRGQLNATPAGS